MLITYDFSLARGRNSFLRLRHLRFLDHDSAGEARTTTGAM